MIKNKSKSHNVIPVMNEKYVSVMLLIEKKTNDFMIGRMEMVESLMNLSQKV